MIDEILAFNRRFVAEKGYERYITDKYPNKRIAIVTCMDTRLVELLPAAIRFLPLLFSDKSSAFLFTDNS